MKTNTLISIVVLTALALSSCSTTSLGFSADTPDELKTMREARLSFGIGGALLGAGAGYLLTKDKGKDEQVAGILGGAAAGGFLGDMLGQKKGEEKVGQKRVAKATEKQLRADIAKAEKFNSALASYNRRLSSEIVQLRKTRDRKQLAASQRYSNTALKQARSQLASQKKYIAAPSNSNGKSRMRSKEVALKAHVARLERNRDELNKISKLSKA